MRHGETGWTISGQYTGVTELSLTDNGRRQAIALRSLLHQVLQGENPVVYSSPRRRARETAELAFLGAPVVLEPRIAEYDYGAYEGLTPEQVASMRPGWNIWRDGCPGGESTDKVSSRADRFLGECVEPAVGPVVVVTHGHFSRILTARALGLPPGRGGLLASTTASVSVIEERNGDRCIRLWNASTDLVEGVSSHARASTPPLVS